MGELTAIRYSDEWEAKWDAFVMDKSRNGTFLQTRRFLNYHPAGRFRDESWLLARENGELAAVLPAALCENDGKPFLRSHPGSTFGGIVYESTVRDAKQLLSLVQAFGDVFKARYAAVELRPTSALFSADGDELLQYCLFHEGYACECELATYLPLTGRTIEELREGYRYNKRADLKKCLSRGLTESSLTTDEEIEAFYELLSLNLLKFDAKPVHTLGELLDFQNARLRGEIAFLGVRDQAGALVAGGCLFYFKQANAWHTQYLATDTRIKGYAPSAFLYDAILRFALCRGARLLSLGTSTFEHGHALNEGLTQSKENYGARHSVNRIYTKAF